MPTILRIEPFRFFFYAGALNRLTKLAAEHHETLLEAQNDFFHN